MKFGNGEEPELDRIDVEILRTLQQDCKISLARIGQKVGLSAPSVIDRIKKLEQIGTITGYYAALDARQLGLDVTAFIGVLVDRPTGIEEFERSVPAMAEVLECHHVTGQYTLLLKVKTESTSSLERLISRLRAIPGVARTETNVVLSTLTERAQIPLEDRPKADGGSRRRGRMAALEPRGGEGVLASRRVGQVAAEGDPASGAVPSILGAKR